MGPRPLDCRPVSVHGLLGTGPGTHDVESLLQAVKYCAHSHRLEPVVLDYWQMPVI